MMENTYEQFVKNMQVDIPYILNWFDSTLALYKLVGQFHLFNIKAESEEGQAVFLINSAEVSDIGKLLECLGRTSITIFSRTYTLAANYDAEQGLITLVVKEVPMIN